MSVIRKVRSDDGTLLTHAFSGGHYAKFELGIISSDELAVSTLKINSYRYTRKRPVRFRERESMLWRHWFRGEDSRLDNVPKPNYRKTHLVWPSQTDSLRGVASSITTSRNHASNSKLFDLMIPDKDKFICHISALIQSSRLAISPTRMPWQVCLWCVRGPLGVSLGVCKSIRKSSDWIFSIAYKHIRKFWDREIMQP